MDQVIVFDKSFQQRLQEYKDVLSGHTVLPISEIEKEWTFFLELSLDANGWQAVWKIPRLTCEHYKIPFPTIVLVFVADIRYETLAAVIKILAVQDDISLPEGHIVPLIQLWPTKAQDKSVYLNMQSTANALDMLRFFYNNLVMPWDHEEDDTSDWVSKHLELRLRLYYDMKNGLIPHTISEHIRGLFVESRRLQEKRRQLELEIGEEDIEIDSICLENMEGTNIQKLLDLHVRVIQIKGEVEILESPLLRKVILKQQEELIPQIKGYVEKFFLLCDPSKVNEYIIFLKQVEQYYPNQIFNFTSNLPSILQEISFNDVVILNKSNQKLNGIAKLDYGGIIKGIYDKKDTIITSKNEDVMFDISGEVVIENVTLNAHMAQCGIIVRRGKLSLKNCKLTGDSKSSTHQGIIVLNGCKLDVMDCDIGGFATAIVGNSGSHISIKNCDIHDVNFGVKVYDNCLISAQKSRFSNCKEYGFCIETEQVFDDIEKVGDFDVLKRIPDMNIDEVNGNNIGKGDFIINNDRKIIPLNDLFTNLDLTYSNSRKVSVTDSEDDMEVTNEEDLNNTVIENPETLNQKSEDEI